MKKAILFLTIALTFISLSSCNLDNEGLLYMNRSRFDSDDKDRNFIGYDETEYFYFVSKNGLERGTAGSSNNETVVMQHDIFTQHYQDIGYLSGNQIVYIDDHHDGQDFYLIDTNGNTPTLLTSNLPSGFRVLEIYSYNGGHYAVARNDENKNDINVYKVEISNGTSLNFTEESFTSTFEGSHSGSYNGLISFDNKCYFQGKQIKLNGESDFTFSNVISFGTSETDIYIIKNSSSRYYFYKGTVSDETTITVSLIEEVNGNSTNEITPCFIDSDGAIYITDYYGTNTPTRIIRVYNNPDSADTGNAYLNESNSLGRNNIVAEAFFKSGDAVYMLSKNNGLFSL